MSAINFVVRDVAGNISRGSVAGEGVASSLVVGAGADVSLNLTSGQILSYTRQGQALEITLIDGRVIVIEGYFTTEGVSENQLFLSADGALSEVELTQGAGADYFASYTQDDGLGKFAASDDLYFIRSSDVMLAEAAPVDDEVGMLGAAIGGLGPLFGLGGAAAVGAAALVAGGGGDGDGGGSTGPVVAVTDGTETTNDVVNEEDHEDGVEIGGTGTPGATVDVTVQDTTETTTVAEDGTWVVVFDPADIETGEYTSPVDVTITNEDGSTTVTDVLVVDTVISVDMDTAGGDDGVINLVEHAAGVTLTGAVTGGDAVVVTIGGVEYDATVDGSTWTLDVSSDVLGEGEYSETVTVVATDAAGNSSSTTSTVVVDTVTSVTVDTSAVGGADNVVNDAEYAGGVTLTGTAQPGASVAVTMAGTTQTVTAGADGTWTSTYASADVPTGESTLDVTVVATDAAGNTATATSTVTVDTYVNELDMTTNTAGGSDGVMNFDESGQAISLAGTVEAGSSVSVELHGVAMTATVDASGNWSVTYPAGTLPGGEYDTTVSVTATDAAGNVAVITDTVTVDTLVNELTANDPVAGDDIVNNAEAAAGVTLGGTVEVGSSVVVTFAHPGGVITRTADVDAAGNWSIAYGPGEVPSGEYDAEITIAATDQYGNTDSITDSFRVDTAAPEAPVVESVTITEDGVRAVEIDNTDNDFTVTEITDAGVVTQLADQDDGIDLGASELFTFNPELPNGTHLVVNETDGAGNENATYVVMEEAFTDAVDLTGLDGFDVGAIDLSFAKDSELTLDLATLNGLSDADNNLIIHGGNDDTITINGAADSGQSTTIGGKSYDIYTMGDDAQIFIEEDVNVTI